MEPARCHTASTVEYVYITADSSKELVQRPQMQPTSKPCYFCALRTDTSPGRITELLTNEEDTITVGQDLFHFKPGTVDKSASREKAPKEASRRCSCTHLDVFGLGKSRSEAVVS